jgi:hypothetical protein
MERRAIEESALLDVRAEAERRRRDVDALAARVREADAREAAVAALEMDVKVEGGGQGLTKELRDSALEEWQEHLKRREEALSRREDEVAIVECALLAKQRLFNFSVDAPAQTVSVEMTSMYGGGGGIMR